MGPSELSGILSNWDSIEADIRVGLQEDFGKSKNLQDIIDIIHELQSAAVTVSPLRDLLERHVKDTDNPHDIRITMEDLDLMQVLYNIYIDKYGADITLSEFTQQFFQIRLLTTRDDVDNLTNLDSVVTPDVMEYLVEKHNADLDAHTTLLRHHFPGVPLASPPSFVIDPSFGVKGLLTVDRDCTATYHDIDGRVKEVPANQLPIDYSYGIPTIPIFGPRRNSLLFSKNITGAIFEGGSRQIEGPLIVTPIDDAEFLLFKEDNTVGRHGWNDVFPEPLDGIQVYYVLVYPVDRHRLRIRLHSDTEDLISIDYNLHTEDISVVGDMAPVRADIQPLANGWFRSSIAFDSTGKNITGAKLDILNSDGEASYQGEDRLTMGFWQHQLTEGSLPVPPIFTEATAMSVLGTKISKGFEELFNPVRGALCIKYISSLPEIFGGFDQLVKLGSDLEEYLTTIDIRTNPTDPTQLQIVSHNESGGVLARKESLPYSTVVIPVKRGAFSYTLGYQGYSFTDTPPKVFTISFGDVLDQMTEFFTEIYDETDSGVYVLQLTSTIEEDAYDMDGTLPISLAAHQPLYRIHPETNLLEIGYSSEADKYLNGYLISFKYYPVFANQLHLEFLMDQYLPED